MALEIYPIPLNEANEFISQHHRHHKPVVGHKFSISVVNDGVVCGVATVGRPVARRLDDGLTLEINRLCTDGTKNAASKLSGSCRKAIFALGYKKAITYTMQNEGGVSMSAAGWKCVGQAGGGNWNCKSRPRVDTEHQQAKFKWESTA